MQQLKQCPWKCMPVQITKTKYAELNTQLSRETNQIFIIKEGAFGRDKCTDRISTICLSHHNEMAWVARQQPVSIEGNILSDANYLVVWTWVMAILHLCFPHRIYYTAYNCWETILSPRQANTCEFSAGFCANTCQWRKWGSYQALCKIQQLLLWEEKYKAKKKEGVRRGKTQWSSTAWLDL